MEKIKNNIVLIGVIGLFAIIVVIYNLMPNDDTDESSTDDIDYSYSHSVSSSNSDVDKDYTHYSDYDYSSDDEPEYYYQKGDTYSARYDDDNDGKVSEDEYMQGMSDLIDDLYEAYISN